VYMYPVRMSSGMQIDSAPLSVWARAGAL